jgi:hypothetical protein
VSRPTVAQVVARAAAEQVVAVPAEELIVAAAGLEAVMAQAAVELVVAPVGPTGDEGRSRSDSRPQGRSSVAWTLRTAALKRVVVEERCSQATASRRGKSHDGSDRAASECVSCSILGEAVGHEVVGSLHPSVQGSPPVAR